MPDRPAAGALPVDPIGRVRHICLALPQAVEKAFGGHTAPSFRIADKLFVSTYEDGSAMVLKARPGVQEELVAAEPDRFFVPAYVGHKGWVGARLDADQDWNELADLITESYRMIAPKRVSALLDSPVRAGGAGPAGRT